MNKAIPLLIGSTEALGHICKILGSMDKKLDQMLDKQDQALGKMDQTLDKQDQALGKMDQTLDKQDETIEQIQDLRVDMVGRSDIRLARMEKDIRQIVSKMGLR